jgi:hypothetical protein
LNGKAIKEVIGKKSILMALGKRHQTKNGSGKPRQAVMNRVVIFLFMPYLLKSFKTSIGKKELSN